ncbi:hypothetical protein BRADI_5g26964v3 [Brachypodium distachyon]|uniref:Uncharacterized protein n=1 Tax=Brachypodium distachyon TaxID=15368 RepID=A0A2K2CJJ9_BRADI|nr:hypothetical protein BRADI_5g26964v3 [Brachypodium distachyon]
MCGLPLKASTYGAGWSRCRFLQVRWCESWPIFCSILLLSRRPRIRLFYPCCVSAGSRCSLGPVCVFMGVVCVCAVLFVGLFCGCSTNARPLILRFNVHLPAIHYRSDGHSGTFSGASLSLFYGFEFLCPVLGNG